MTTDELAGAIIQTSRKRAGEDGAVMIEAAKIVIELLQGIATLAQQQEPEAGDGWLKLIRAALPEK